MLESRAKASHPKILLALLVSAVGINYIDRGLVSVAAPLLSREFSLSPVQLGLLMSAFFWSYAGFQLVAGWLSDRFDVKVLFAAGFLVWSLATVGMGFSNGLAALVVLRVILGVGEAIAYPATSRIIAEGYPEHRRGFANALVDAGSRLGPTISTLLGGLFVDRFGWRSVFLTVGLVSLVWLIPWQRYAPSGGMGGERAQEAQVSWSDLLRRRSVWGASVGMFCLGYVWYFLLSWLPKYLYDARGLNLKATALLGALPFFAAAVSSVLCGLWADRWIAKGGDAVRVRRGFLVVGLGGCGALLYPVATVRTLPACMALLVCACVAMGFFSSNVWALTQRLAGPAAAGRWTGIQNAVGNLGGVVSPVVTGWLATKFGSYGPAFFGASLVGILGSVVYWVFVGREEQKGREGTAV